MLLVDFRGPQNRNKIMKRELIPKEFPTHIVRRGARGLPFARDNSDRWRNLQTLFYLNDSSSRVNWFRELEESRKMVKRENDKQHFFIWPNSWPKQNPLIYLWAFIFNNNHDHFISKEKQERGTSKFMQKIEISTTKHFNKKYGEKGTVFQGPYQIKIIENDRYLQWVVPYVMVKNTFEMHPKGYKWAVNNFEEAWKWAINYPFSSLGDYVGVRNSPIVTTEPLKKILGGPKEFKQLCKYMILGREKIKDLKFSKIITLSFEEESK